MASDEDYMAFLDKANQDPSAGHPQQQSTTSSGSASNFKARDDGEEVPKAIAAALKKGGERVYVSDADEPFEGVALRWDEAGKGLPDEVEFAQLIQHPSPEKAGVDIMDPIDWDREGEYGDLIEAVREAGKGNDVRVYKVPSKGTRTEYWVLTTDGRGKDAKLVGVKALAVES